VHKDHSCALRLILVISLGALFAVACSDLPATPPAGLPTPRLKPGPSATPTLTIPTETRTPESQVRIPAHSDWVDYGTILEAGAPGEWDLYLWGGDLLFRP
jgi:hypothetical protein